MSTQVIKKPSESVNHIAHKRNQSHIEKEPKNHPFQQNMPRPVNENLDSKQKNLDHEINNYNRTLGHNDSAHYPVENNIHLQERQSHQNDAKIEQHEANDEVCKDQDAIQDKIDELEREKERLQNMVREKEASLKQARQ